VSPTAIVGKSQYAAVAGAIPTPSRSGLSQPHTLISGPTASDDFDFVNGGERKISGDFFEKKISAKFSSDDIDGEEIDADANTMMKDTMMKFNGSNLNTTISKTANNATNNATKNTTNNTTYNPATAITGAAASNAGQKGADSTVATDSTRSSTSERSGESSVSGLAVTLR
jgi:hypothetical protein